MKQSLHNNKRALYPFETNVKETNVLTNSVNTEIITIKSHPQLHPQFNVHTVKERSLKPSTSSYVIFCLFMLLFLPK